MRVNEQHVFSCVYSIICKRGWKNGKHDGWYHLVQKVNEYIRLHMAHPVAQNIFLRLKYFCQMKRLCEFLLYSEVRQ